MHRCEICGKTFKTSQALASHKMHKHGEGRGPETAEAKFWEFAKMLDNGATVYNAASQLELPPEKVEKYVEDYLKLKQLDVPGAEIPNLIRKIEEIERRLDNVCVRLRTGFGREMIKSLCPACKKFTYLKYDKRVKRWVCENCGQPV